MRRLIAVLFAVTALTILGLRIYEAYALPLALTKPLADCKDGVCTMSETDYRALQKFHSQLVTAATDLAEDSVNTATELSRTRRALIDCMHRRT